MIDEAVAGTALVALLLISIGIASLARRSREARHGILVAVDSGHRGRKLTSERYRLVGTPDELRRRPDGRIVPVEWKSGRAPLGGPHRSHRVQVAAYCLLVEETEGRPPPYGVLRYGDGSEFTVPWDAPARAAVLAGRRELDRPYDGRADPSPGKCAGCRWRPGCDASAVGGGPAGSRSG